MIYLLGGPPRVGKSILSSMIRKKYAVSVVSTDTLGSVLENVLSPEMAPDLFVVTRFNELPMAMREELLLKNPAELMDIVETESRFVWKAVMAYIMRENDEGRDALIEGAAVLPGLVHQLEDIPYRVVFIGNQGKKHSENIKRSAEENEHDWMRHVNRSYMEAFAVFVNQMSACIEQEANRCGFRYIEMNKKSFGDAVEEAAKSLGLHQA